MERCPSGLRCMIGNHVAGEYRHGGSNPPLSATNVGSVRNDRALLLCLVWWADVKTLPGKLGYVGAAKLMPSTSISAYQYLRLGRRTSILVPFKSQFCLFPVAEMEIRYIM